MQPIHGAHNETIARLASPPYKLVWKAQIHLPPA